MCTVLYRSVHNVLNETHANYRVYKILCTVHCKIKLTNHVAKEIEVDHAHLPYGL